MEPDLSPLDPLSHYDLLQERLRIAKAETATARDRYNTAVAEEQSAERDLITTRQVLVQKITNAPSGQRPPKLVVSEPSEPDGTDDPSPTGVQRSLRELIIAFPREAHVGVDDLQEHFKITKGALNTRIMKAKRAGLVESAGWGRYKLTPEGQKVQDNRLKIVT